MHASIVAEQTVEFQPFELPDRPGASEVIIKVDRTIVSAGTELANYTGLDPDTRVPGRWCAYPWLPGYGGIGRVVEAGQAVTHLAAGDRVYGIFHHASYAVEDTNNRLCVKVPEGLDSNTAVMARMAGVAITGYRRTRDLALTDTLVVIGLGLVGNLAGQFFHAAGQRVIGIDLSERRRALALEMGFLAALDPAEMPEDALWEQVRELNGGSPVPVIVDAVGDSHLVERAIHYVADNGQVVMLGTPRAPYCGDITAAFKRAHFHGVEIIGALEWTIPLLKRRSPGVTTEANAELIYRMLVDGNLNVGPLISHVLPPAKLNEAYQGLLHCKDEYLGVILDWENNPAPMV
ncbi:MAG TPA: zinc-binding dehydrogenase [Chthonomonadales bacterium]|nr:zinc-binding dehydrogenase [Chthonomonadales bacterium]